MVKSGIPGVKQVVHSKLSAQRAPVRFGVIGKGFAYGHWFLGTKGHCEWLLADEQAPLQKPGDPDCYQRSRTSLAKLLVDKPVDVILCIDLILGPTSEVWRNPTVKLIGWVAKAKSRSGTKVPRGWSIQKSTICHNLVGGVTDGKFYAEVGVRVGSDGWNWEPDQVFVFNTLRQVVDPTVGGRRTAIVHGDSDLQNTAHGLLGWNRRFDNVSVPTVYSKTHWGRRRLNDKELCDALDIPANVSSRRGPTAGKILRQVPVPGKVLSFVISGICGYRSGTGEKLSGVKRRGEKLEKEAKIPKTDPEVSCLGKRHRTEKVEEQPIASKKERKVSTSTEQKEGTTVTSKATKLDNASIPEYLWNDRVLSRFPHLSSATDGSNERLCVKVKTALGTLRSWLLRRWKRKTEQDFLVWFHGSEHLTDKREDIEEKGLRACVYARRCSWWEWDGGSGIFFWRWPVEYLDDSLYGVPPRFIGPEPTYFSPQPPYSEKDNVEKVTEKVSKVLKTRYLTRCRPNTLRALMFMFDVPKGNEDVRMVYDGSKSGLNDALFAPWFALPTVEAMVRTLLPGYWCADNDYGDHFLNFPLHSLLQVFCGVDLSQLFPEEAKRKEYMLTAVWMRNAMGLKPSPYASIQGALRAKRIALGNKNDSKNPFQWERIKLNLPSSEDYDPSFPWISKIRKDGRLAADLHQYVDDMRLTAPDKELAWEVSSRVAKMCCWLGLQDAARNARGVGRVCGIHQRPTSSETGDTRKVD